MKNERLPNGYPRTTRKVEVTSGQKVKTVYPSMPWDSRYWFSRRARKHIKDGHSGVYTETARIKKEGGMNFYALLATVLVVVVILVILGEV